MEYHKLVDSSKYPLLHIHLQNSFLHDQLADIRCLLRLPQKRLPAGCNYTAASSIFNLIGGISICFFDASLQKFNSTRGRGPALQELLRRYYPWKEEGLKIPEQRAIDALYNSVRNPLTHSLGLYKTSDRDRIRIVKSKLTNIQIAKLEDPLCRPSYLPPTISEETFTQYRRISLNLILNIPSLYWGLSRLLYLLFRDDSQSMKTEQFLRDLSSEYKKAHDTNMGLAKL